MLFAEYPFGQSMTAAETREIDNPKPRTPTSTSDEGVDCVGYWLCDEDADDRCEPTTWQVETDPKNGGKTCAEVKALTAKQPCADSQGACVKKDCVGEWACSSDTCLRTWETTSEPAGMGRTCDEVKNNPDIDPKKDTECEDCVIKVSGATTGLIVGGVVLAIGAAVGGFIYMMRKKANAAAAAAAPVTSI